MKGVIIGLFIVLLAGSVYFSLERILFCDASFIMFRILNLDSLQIQEHRYGSFITQAVPLLGGRLDLPLKAIVVLYSSSFNFFYLLVAALLVFAFRETRLAILMAFYYVLFVSDNYFWTNNEVHQGIAWMFLLFGLTGYMMKKNLNWLVLLPCFIVLAGLAIFTHPLVIFPTLFLWLFLLVHEKLVAKQPVMSVITVLVIIIFAIIKYKTSIHTTSFYDSEKLKVFKDVSASQLIGTFRSPMAIEIFKRSLTNYWLLPLLMLAGLYSAMLQKKYVAIVLVTGFCLAYFMAVCLTFSNFIPFYTESEWMPVSIIATALFVFYTLPKLSPRNGTLIIAAIFIVRLVYIGNSSVKFTERKEWLFATLEKMREQKINKGIVIEDDHNRKKLIMHWGVPAESIIASALQKDSTQKTFAVLPEASLQSQVPDDPHLLFMSFFNMHYSELNPRYFNFDTTAGYQIINSGK